MYMKNKLLDYFYLILLFISPVIFLAIKNFDNTYPLNFIPSFIFLIIVSTIIYILFNLLFREKTIKFLYFFYLFWFFQFYINSTNFNFFNLSNFNQKILILIVVILISFFLSFYLNQYIKNFIIIFIFMNFIYLSSGIFITKNSNQLNSSEYYKKMNLKFDSKENIYFIIFDQMTSKKLYLEKFDLDISQNISNFQKKGFKYLHNTETNNLISIRVISSIFNLNEDVSVDEKNIFLSENVENYELLTLLNKNDYKTWYLDNDMVKCPRHSLINCISRGKSSLINSPIYHLFSVSIFNKFYKYLIYEYFESFKKDRLYSETEIDKFFKFHKNNQKLIQNKKNFIFIHNLGPHYPYRDVNCKITSLDYKMSEDEVNDYKLSSLCVLKKISEFIRYIEKFDSNAVIIIQGDHGFSANNDVNSRDRSVFNLVKIPNNCNLSLKPVTNNIDTFKNILRCI